MDKLNLMTSFVQVAELRSYTQAAKRLGKTKALMSTHVAQLEALLDVRLIDRNTRGIQLTPTGKAYYEQARRVLDEIATLERQLQHDHHSLAGRLRISAPSTFGELVLMPFIAHFGGVHPGLDIEVMLNDRYVDLVSEGFDLAVRIGTLEDSNLIARKVGEMKVVLCASPAFIAKHGMPEDPQALANVGAIEDTNVPSNKPWRCALGEAESTLAVRPKIAVNSALAAARLAANSHLIARCPDFAVKELMDRRQLIQLLPYYDFGKSPIHVVYNYRKHLSSKVTTLVD